MSVTMWLGMYIAMMILIYLWISIMSAFQPEKPDGVSHREHYVRGLIFYSRIMAQRMGVITCILAGALFGITIFDATSPGVLVKSQMSSLIGGFLAVFIFGFVYISIGMAFEELYSDEDVNRE